MRMPHVSTDPHAGNLACDEQEGGRLIFYDYGMMDGLGPQVRAGLVNLLFSIYENEPKPACDALEQMGILKVRQPNLSCACPIRSQLTANMIFCNPSSTV